MIFPPAFLTCSRAVLDAPFTLILTLDCISISIGSSKEFKFDKLMVLCKSVDSVKYKKFLEIFQSEEHSDWGIENTGHHGLGTPKPEKIMSTYNWDLKNYPPV